jgi:hypothetical protein
VVLVGLKLLLLLLQAQSAVVHQDLIRLTQQRWGQIRQQLMQQQPADAGGESIDPAAAPLDPAAAAAGPVVAAGVPVAAAATLIADAGHMVRQPSVALAQVASLVSVTGSEGGGQGGGAGAVVGAGAVGGRQ